MKGMMRHSVCKAEELHVIGERDMVCFFLKRCVFMRENSHHKLESVLARCCVCIRYGWLRKGKCATG